MSDDSSGSILSTVFQILVIFTIARCVFGGDEVDEAVNTAVDTTKEVVQTVTEEAKGIPIAELIEEFKNNTNFNVTINGKKVTGKTVAEEANLKVVTNSIKTNDGVTYIQTTETYDDPVIQVITNEDTIDTLAIYEDEQEIKVLNSVPLVKDEAMKTNETADKKAEWWD
jgi:hypothetical protein